MFTLHVEARADSDGYRPSVIRDRGSRKMRREFPKETSERNISSHYARML
jgi:hypothetical protein